MKNIFKFIIVLALFSACNNDFLEREPFDLISSGQVYEDESLAKAYLLNLMDRLPTGHFNYQAGMGVGYGSTYILASITDEARAKSGWIPANRHVLPGNITSSNYAGLDIWNHAYGSIRQANLIIEGLESSETLPDEVKADISTKARYVRAWAYFDLVRRYGDVPLIKKSQTFESENLFPARNPKSEIYDFINSELTAIEANLKDRSASKTGEINKQTAIALNARAMLYAERWTESAALADRLITGENNDGLDLHDNYRNLFLSKGGNNEVIFEITYVREDRAHDFSSGNFPVRWRNKGGGQTDPTQEMVDAFEMIVTGLPITNTNSGYDPNNPYFGRDNRFYASIFYHGSAFEGLDPFRGEPFIDMEWNKRNEGPGTSKDGNASITGYFVKKFADPDDGLAPIRLYTSTTSWKEFRFAEILLIYAEAQNEASGVNDKVYSAINRVRNRAGLPDLPTGLSQSEMRERIIQERRVEFCFENHRWFDLIRWRKAVEVLDGYIPHGVKITRKSTTPPVTEDEYVFEPEKLDFNTEYVVGGRNQSFPERMYLLPIPQSEMDKNSNLVQNTGY